LDTYYPYTLSVKM